MTFPSLGFLIYRNAEFCHKFLQFSILEVIAEVWLNTSIFTNVTLKAGTHYPHVT